MGQGDGILDLRESTFPYCSFSSFPHTPKKNPFFHDMEFKLTINYTGLI